jgi:hypothetical protein
LTDTVSWTLVSHVDRAHTVSVASAAHADRPSSVAGYRRGPSRRSFVPVIADAVHRARVRRVVRRPDDDAPGARNFTAARDGNLDFVLRLAARDRPVVPTLAVPGLDRRRARPVVDGVGDGDLDADGVARGRSRHSRRRDVVHGSRNRSGRGDLLG